MRNGVHLLNEGMKDVKGQLEDLQVMVEKLRDKFEKRKELNGEDAEFVQSQRFVKLWGKFFEKFPEDGLKNRKGCHYKGCKQVTQWYCLKCGEDELEAWCAASGLNHRYLHWKRVHKTKEERQEELVEEAKEEVTAKNDEEEIVHPILGARQPYTSSSFLALYLLQLVH